MSCRIQRRCWWISSRPASITCRTFTPPAASARCCASCGRCCNLDCMTVAGVTLKQVLDQLPPWVDRAVVREFKNPISPVGGLVGLFGSLAPNGAILKRSAADPTLFEKEGRAVVFSSLDDLSARVDDPDLDIKPDDFMVLQNAGPEVRLRDARGGLPADPVEARARRREGHGAHLGCAHERHRVRHHRAARFARGGRRRRAGAGEERRPHPPFGEGAKHRPACGREGDSEKQSAWKAPVTAPTRGYAKLYMDHVLQAEHGCDFDF